MLRWGFIGAGFVASRALAPAVHASPTAHLQAVASRSATSARALSATSDYADYDALLADPKVDAVYISLPNHLHAPWAIAALNAGKHVLCEKPFATSVLETRAMIAAAEAQDLVLMEAIWFRWHPRTRRLAELVGGGHIGPITAVTSHFSFELNAPNNYRLDPTMGGGSLFDLGPYPLHLWSVLAGNSAQIKYTAVSREMSDRGADLTTLFSAVIGETVKAEATLSFIQAPAQRINIVGETGAIAFNRGEAFTSWREPSGLTMSGAEELFAPADPYQLMIEDFYAVTQGAPNINAPLSTTLFVSEQLERIRAIA